MSTDPDASHPLRKVFVVGTLRDDESAVLADRGWPAATSATVDEAAIRLTQEPCGPVLLVLTSTDPEYLAQIRTLACAHAQRRWLTVVEPAQIADQAVRELISDCCWDYCTRPVDAPRFAALLGHAMGMAALLGGSPSVAGDTADEFGIIGCSPAAVDLRRMIEKMARVDAPVLIVGETGTGKELAARAIHAISRRGDRPFDAVNCAALPPTLIHAELFGYEKGAFTGATKRKIGHFESADSGTMFLDEIGDLPESMQTTLLRFLEEHVIRRVGGTKDVPVDLRIISATHVNLRKAIQEGRFREDLFFRLDVLQLRVPPLRERGEDVLLLANHFLRQFAAEIGASVKGFGRDTERVIAAYRWPGNVRELRNRVYRGVVMREKGLVSPQDMGFEPVQRAVESVASLDEARARAEENAINAALRQADGDTRSAAAALGVSRATLYRLMEKLNIGQHAS
jgi:DNA-binding NtrC family response regulator